MCGILGYYSAHPMRAHRLESMLGLLQHRGPDHQGVFYSDGVGLAAARLALVGGDEGNQPVRCRNGQSSLVLNGEIYNWSDLGEAHATSDSQVTMTVLLGQGESGLASFRGGFALGFYDGVRRSLLLARDQFGQKPLYYRIDDEGVIFASEPQVFSGFGVSSQIDRASLSSLLRFQFLPPRKSLFAGTRVVKPGSWIEFSRSKRGELVVSGGTIDLPTSEPAESVGALFASSCERQKTSGEPAALLLSGGLDSTAVLGGLSAVGATPSNAFVGYFPDGPSSWDERPYARFAAQTFGSSLHEVAITPRSFADAMPLTAAALGEPIAGPGSVSQFILCREASQEHRVIFGGQGGDELFGGYARLGILQGITERSQRQHETAYEPLFVRMQEAALRRPLDKLAAYRAAVDRGRALELLGSESARLLLSQATSIEDCLTSPRNDDPMSAALDFEWQVLLPGLLQVDDRCCSAFGTEGRSPFLDQDLTAHVLPIPLAEKSPPTSMRKLFLDEFSEILPERIAKRSDKLGFPHPLASWWRGPLKQFAEDVLNDSTHRDLVLVEKKNIPTLLQNDGQGGRLVYFLLMFEFWQRAFLDQTKMAQGQAPPLASIDKQEKVEEK